ncbi:MAG: tetratricopeptide repeat protein [Bacteroidetes bacterium]|nr:tetratricopeptide repeat protein [Bacteroidota bacterium]
MRIFIPALVLVLFGYSAFSSTRTDSILNQLKIELKKKKSYDEQKELRIKDLKDELKTIPATNYGAQYSLCEKLYDEYKVYQSDSAYVYTEKLLALSAATHNIQRLNESKIKLSFLLLSAGMFKETFECLDQINTKVLDNRAKLEYYSVKSRAYSDLADYNSDKSYAPYDQQQAVKFIDSAIALTEPGSFEQLYYMGNKQVISGQFQQPSTYYLTLLNRYKLSEHERAMVATGLSFFFSGPYQEDDRDYLLAEGAINDIRSSTKETLAIFKLGQQLYLQGNIKDAYTFIQEAMNDADFYGARLRKMKISAVLPIVATQKILITENEKNKFLKYFLVIAVIAVLFSLGLFVVFIQLKRVQVKERIIEEKNAQLERINGKLVEDTHIKEEYIGYFFNVISGYILKLEKLKRSIERKVVTKKYDDILASVNEINIKKERETLFYTFDHVFLKIFPNFISNFNSFFKKEDQIWPKDHEVLNTDLRIFALMRLGINDIETIANILEYSVNTIYVYKMRIKAKALIPGDQFDHQIMSIKAVETLNSQLPNEPEVTKLVKSA